MDARKKPKHAIPNQPNIKSKQTNRHSPNEQQKPGTLQVNDIVSVGALFFLFVSHKGWALLNPLKLGITGPKILIFVSLSYGKEFIYKLERFLGAVAAGFNSVGPVDTRT